MDYLNQSNRNVMVLAATNLPHLLDPAILRPGKCSIYQLFPRSQLHSKEWNRKTGPSHLCPTIRPRREKRDFEQVVFRMSCSLWRVNDVGSHRSSYAWVYRSRSEPSS
jgi:hypothetical protein